MRERKPTSTVIVDLDRCLACKSCEMACAKAHAGFEDIVEAVLSEAHMASRVKVVAAAGRAVPVQCQHCEDAPCVTVCPSGALYQDEVEGIVRAVTEKCIGCKNCVVVCPFGAVDWDKSDRTVVKCDLCEDLIEEGEEPACVTQCPTNARRVVRLEDLSKQRRQDAAERTVAMFSQSRGSSAQEEHEGKQEG